MKTIKVIDLEWELFWLQEKEAREFARTPLGETYHVSNRGWWHALCPLHPAANMAEAKKLAQQDFKNKVLLCVTTL